jgi:hypothetical protein
MAQPRRRLIKNEPLYVRKPFTINGQTAVAGKEFKYRRLSISPRRVMQLYETGYLVGEEMAKHLVQVLKPVRDDESTGQGLEMIAVGGGWWDVLKDGVRQNEKTLRKDDASELLASMQESSGEADKDE